MTKRTREAKRDLLSVFHIPLFALTTVEMRCIPLHFSGMTDSPGPTHNIWDKGVVCQTQEQKMKPRNETTQYNCLFAEMLTMVILTLYFHSTVGYPTYHQYGH